MDVSNDVITNLRRTQYTQPKLIFAKIASVLEAFPDTDGSYASVDTNLFYDGDKKMQYYAGILNSYMANFLYAGMFGALRMRDGDFQYQAPQLRLLPIPEADTGTEQSADIDDTVNKLLDRNHQRELLLEIWSEESELLSDETRSLVSTLSSDKEYRQEGRRNLAWSSGVTFYPDANDDRLEDEHPDFFITSPSTEILAIFGLDDQIETKLYEIEFRSQELKDHVFASIEKTVFRTRKRIESLKDILEKVEVPVVRRDSAENTPNIISAVEERFREEADSEYSDCEIISSIAALESEIQRLEVELNSHVLADYGVSEEKVPNVLNDVNVRESEMERIITAYDEMDVDSEDD